MSKNYPDLKPEAIPRPGCRSFLLRCWPEAGPGSAVAWRFTLLEISGDPAKRGFACLEDVMVHLQGELTRLSSRPAA